MCRHTDAPVTRPGPIRLSEDTTLVGEFRSSGYREPPGLVSRGDGQLVRLPQLLYLVAELIDEHAADPAADAETMLAAVAADATARSGVELAAEHVEFLVDNKLAPLGVTTYVDGSEPAMARPTPLLSLRLRTPLLNERATWRMGGLFGWLFRFPVLVAAIAVALAADLWVFGTQHVGDALRSTLAQPTSILVVVALAVASTAFHECGHATACRYSGARPGAMGCGVYLVWPAFYTDITNSYRLSRAGRLRTDLGGVYFNGLFLLALTGAYLSTHYPPLLVAVLSVNIEIIQQLLPTLRFDGYYIVADLVGVPDLFRYVGPILRHTVLRRPQDPKLGLLKRWPQIVVTGWVLLVVPVLAAQLGFLVTQLPGLARADWLAIGALIRQAAGGNVVLGVVSATVRILLLLLPLAGAAVVFGQLARMAVRLARRRLPPLMPRRALVACSAAGFALLAGGVAWALVPAGHGPATTRALQPAPAHRGPATSMTAPPTTPAPSLTPAQPTMTPVATQVPTPQPTHSYPTPEIARHTVPHVWTPTRRTPSGRPPGSPPATTPSPPDRGAGVPAHCDLLGVPLPSLVCGL